MTKKTKAPAAKKTKAPVSPDDALERVRFLEDALYDGVYLLRRAQACDKNHDIRTDRLNHELIDQYVNRLYQQGLWEPRCGSRRL
jgi:hypothetical protein